MPVSDSRPNEAHAGPPARYFPVDRKPLHMRPRLQPFGSDCGHGALDARYFQLDEQLPHYLASKRPDRYRIAQGSASEDAAHRAVLAFAEETAIRELPGFRPRSGDFASRYTAISAEAPEDFVVQLRDRDGRDRTIASYVSFPSRWRPEEILGRSFWQIHEQVPDFADADAAARSLVDAMVERGPYLRFVWTVCSDGELDHHLDESAATHFGPETREGWLRIERQVTVPFPAEGASLFLIRTYLRAFGTLDPEERETLRIALDCLPAATARYKGLEGCLEHAMRLLED